MWGNYVLFVLDKMFQVLIGNPVCGMIVVTMPFRRGAGRLDKAQGLLLSTKPIG
jgi:hypothetical protein